MKLSLTELAFKVESTAGVNPFPELEKLYGGYYRPYYHLLYNLAQTAYKQELLCVELGVEKGRGCASMALTGADVVGVDHFRSGEIAVVESTFPNFSFLEMDSLPVPTQIKRPIGVLHVDTEHTYAQAREELKGYAPLLADGAVVCFDDLHAMNDAVAKFFFKLDCPKIADDRLHECGYGVILYRKGMTIPE